MKLKTLALLSWVCLGAAAGPARAEGWKDLSGQADAPTIVAFNNSKNHPETLPFIPQRKLEAGFWTAYRDAKVIEKIGQTTVKSDTPVVWTDTGLWMHLLVGASWVSLPVYDGLQATVGAVKTGETYYGLHPAFWKSLQATRPPSKKSGSPAPAESLKTGAFVANLGEFSGPAATPNDSKANPLYDYHGEPAKEEANVEVPGGYDGSKPFGLIVFITAAMNGNNAPPGGWRGELAEKNIIWIGARNGGNNHPGNRRVWLAQQARAWALHHYRIDPARMTIAGFSNGADAASATTVATPFGFNGAIYFSPACKPPLGVVPIPREEGGNREQVDVKPLSTSGMAHIKRDWRVAYVVGVKDNFLTRVRADAEAVKGFDQGSKLFEIAGMGHGLPPSIKDVLDFIDGPRESASAAKGGSGFAAESYLQEIRTNLATNPERARATMAQLWQNHTEARTNADVLALLAKMEALP